MSRFIPDVLTGLRVLCAAMLLWALIGADWSLALLALLIGIISDAIDGEIARKLGLPKTSYGELFDQAADGLLWGALFVGLWWSDQLSPILLVAILLGGVILEAVSHIPRESRWWFVRRHAHWIHPFSYAVTLGIGLVWLTWLAAWPAMAISICCFYAAGAIIIVDLKRLRIGQFLAGP